MSQGLLIPVQPKTPPLSRDALLRDAVIEAARQLMAAELRVERAAARDASGVEWEDVVMAKEEAWQTLRDSLSAERATR